MDKNQFKLNTKKYPFMSTDKTTKIFNSNKTGVNFSIDVLTGEQQYDINNAYELSYLSKHENSHENDKEFNLEKSLKKLRNTFERATRYCNSRVPSINRQIISKTFENLLKPSESITTPSKYMIDKQMIENFTKSNQSKKSLNKAQRKSNSCFNLKSYTASSNKLKWNKSFTKRPLNISNKLPSKNRAQILRQKDIAIKYKKYLKPTTIVKNMKQKSTYSDNLKSLERSSVVIEGNDNFRTTKRSMRQNEIPPSKLKLNNLSKRSLPQRKLNKLLKPLSYDPNIIVETEITCNNGTNPSTYANNENKRTNNALTMNNKANKLLVFNEPVLANEEIPRKRNFSNFSTNTVNTVTLSPLSIRNESVQTGSDLKICRPTTDTQSQTLPQVYWYNSTEYCETASQRAGTNIKENILKSNEKSSLQFRDIETSFKNICSVLSIKSLIMNKNVNGENADYNNTKSSLSSLNRLQVNEIYTDTYTKDDRRCTSKIKNANYHLTTFEENNKLSLEQIHLNKTKILNMEICRSNAESIKISQIGSTKSSEKSCPSSSDELYQVIRSKIDRVLSGRHSFTYEKTFEDNKKKSQLQQHREEITKIVNGKNGHYLSKSLSRDSFELISKCGKHSKMNNSCKLIKTLAYRIQRLEMQALHEQALHLKQQKRLDLLENYLRELYMLSLSDDKTAIRTLTAIKEGFCDLNVIHERKVQHETPQRFAKELLNEPLQPEIQHFNASKKQLNGFQAQNLLISTSTSNRPPISHEHLLSEKLGHWIPCCLLIWCFYGFILVLRITNF